jgi:hypothetical protein
MAQDKLAGIVRALVGVPQERLVVVQRVVNNLNKAYEHGNQFQIELSKFILGWRPAASENKPGFAEFFGNRSGLWVSDEFRGLVLSRAEVAEAVEVNHFDLQRDMLDLEIEQKLGENHIFTEDALCATLQKMLEEESEGQSVMLLNNGDANLFYTRSCIVYVFCFGVSRGWFVKTERRDGGVWHAGSRAFSPATGAQQL